MSKKLITANPNDNSATVVCKIISLVPSFFMGRSLLCFSPNNETAGIQSAAWKNWARRVAAPGRRVRISQIEKQLAGDCAASCVKLVPDAGSQKGNPADDDHRDQRHQQTVLHRARTRLIFEKILDPFHFFIPFLVIGFLWLWVAPVNKLLNFGLWYSY
jgi:hypothetical protein